MAKKYLGEEVMGQLIAVLDGRRTTAATPIFFDF
jgi:hypothetical protein